VLGAVMKIATDRQSLMPGWSGDELKENRRLAAAGRGHRAMPYLGKDARLVPGPPVPHRRHRRPAPLRIQKSRVFYQYFFQKAGNSSIK
jgi:hypothetical protein